MPKRSKPDFFDPALATEEWLADPDAEKFAAAMVRCKHAGAYCGQDGFCHFDGECFNPTPAQMLRRAEEALAQAERVVADMRAVVESLRKGDSHV